MRSWRSRLNSHGRLRVWFDQWAVKPGDPILHKIEQGDGAIADLGPGNVKPESHPVPDRGRRSGATHSGSATPSTPSAGLFPCGSDDVPVKDALRQYLHIDWRPKSYEEYAELLAACRPPAIVTSAAGRTPWMDSPGHRTDGGIVARIRMSSEGILAVVSTRGGDGPRVIRSLGMSNNLIEDLRQEIANGQVIAIVGAGVSIGATNNNAVASWIGLLRDGVERCLAVVPGLPSGWAERVRSEIESGDSDDLLSAAEKISSKLGSQGGEYGRWLRETVGALRIERSDVITALKELGVPIATTNYDSLIEQVTGWPPVTWRQGMRRWST